MGGLGQLAAGALKPITELIGKAITDKDLKLQTISKIQEMFLQGKLDVQLAQIGVNLQQAKSKFWWVAGARPGFMWGCLLIILFNYIGAPTYNSIRFGTPIDVVDMENVWPLVGSLLGVAGLRTYEKFTGTEKNR